MTLAETYSWIFYALALASNAQNAKYRDIEQIADGINHAIPTQKEMRESLAWLNAEDLIIKKGKAYSLSEKGKDLLEKLSNDINSTRDVWQRIENHFAKCGVDNKKDVNPNTLTT